MDNENDKKDDGIIAEGAEPILNGSDDIKIPENQMGPIPYLPPNPDEPPPVGAKQKGRASSFFEGLTSSFKKLFSKKEAVANIPNIPNYYQAGVPAPQPPQAMADGFVQTPPVYTGELSPAAATYLPIAPQVYEYKPQGAKTMSRKNLAIIIVGALALLAAFIWGGSQLFGGDGPLNLNKPEIVAITADDSDFLETGKFSISGVSGISAEELAKNLSFSPAIDFTVEKESNSSDIAYILAKNFRNTDYKGVYTFINKAGNSQNIRFTVNEPALGVKSTTVFSDLSSPFTLEFTEEVDPVSLEENLDIYPQTDIVIEYDLNKVWIYPKSGEWQEGTYYTLTILDTYEATTGKMFSAERVMNINPMTTAIKKAVVIPRISGDFITNIGKSIMLNFSAENLDSAVNVIFTVHKIPSIKQYSEQKTTYRDIALTLDNLEMVGTDVGEIVEGENTFDIGSYPEGAYIVKSVYKDPQTSKVIEKRTGFLVTPLSLYAQSSEMETVVWLNNSDTGNAASGYKIEFYENGILNSAGITDADGLATIAHFEPKESESSVEEKPLSGGLSTLNTSFKVYDEDNNMVYTDEAFLSRELRNRNFFYSYLYTDRPIYKPTDTISFWGYARPFELNSSEASNKIIVKLESASSEDVVATKEVTIDEFGVFSGEITLDHLISSEYYISASIEIINEDSEKPNVEHQLDTKYLSIKEYEKPLFTISSSTDKEFYLPGEEATVTVELAFFDGTPLPYYDFEFTTYSEYGNGKKTENLKTDEHGKASFTYIPSEVIEDKTRSLNLDFYWPSYTATISDDKQNIVHRGQMAVFISDTVYEYELRKQENGQNFEMVVKSYEIDFTSEKLISYFASLFDESMYYPYVESKKILEFGKGAPSDGIVDMEIYWYYYDTKGIHHKNNQSPNYSYTYNYYSDSYSTNLEEGSVEAIPAKPNEFTQTRVEAIKTVNGVAVLSDLILLQEGVSIDFSKEILLRVYNKLHKENVKSGYSFSAYHPTYDYYNYYENESQYSKKGYKFNILNSKGDMQDGNYNHLNVDETYTAVLYKDGEIAPADISIYYSLVKGSAVISQVMKGNRFNFTTGMNFFGYSKIYAAVFDGRQTNYVSPKGFSISKKSLKVDITVTPDKPSYRPGDTVKLRVNASDPSGKGVAGNLCLSVVDEAIFALGADYIDLTYSLYYDLERLSSTVRRYCTTYRGIMPFGPEAGGDGGKGGEGSDFYDSYRKNFKDTAIFLALRTDANGNATAEFILPDNTTSWRITTLHVGDNLYSGNDTHNIISSLPFFIQPIVNPKYISGDDIAMLVQGHGTLIDKDSEIDYTVNLKGDGFDETKEISSKAFTSEEVNFGSLPEGEYTLVAKAKFSGYSDTVELPITVVKNNLELVINRPIDPSLPIDIDASRSPVSISFFNKEHTSFMTSISSLLGHYCMMANQRMSRFVARQVLEESLVGETVPSYLSYKTDSISDMQNTDGGIFASSYKGSSEVMMTMYAALIAPDQFSKVRMIKYLQGQLISSSDAKIKAACLLGLSALGEDNIKDIKAMLEKEKNMDIQAYLVAALAYSGETEAASTYYNNLFSAHIKTLYAKKRVYKEEMVWDEKTAAVWIAASLLNQVDADEISVYYGQRSWRYRTLFECMIYVKNYSRKLEETSFSYTTGGEKINVSLGSFGIKTLSFTKSEIEALNISDIKGSLSATAYYIGEPEEMDIQPSKNIKLTKTIGKSTSSGDDKIYYVSIRLDLTADAPIGQYDLSDWVPSNSRLYSWVELASPLIKDVYYSVKTENQKIYISFNNSTKAAKTVFIKYKIKRAFMAEAMIAPTYIIHGETGENARTEAAKLIAEKLPEVEIGDFEESSGVSGIKIYALAMESYKPEKKIFFKRSKLWT